MATYSLSSPYYNTPVVNGYLDVTTFRNFPKESDDVLWEVTKTYENRPDLLAFDLYQDVNLWWVFAIRNPAIIKDPVYDLVAGKSIYLPKLSTLKSSLGI